LLAGPYDPLPPNVSENEVTRPSVPALIRELSSADWVIANDSGPMHLAAFLGAKTIVIALISNIQEWLPPGAIPVCSQRMPKGHMPISLYTTDEILEGWPEPERVIEKLISSKVFETGVRL
jgi:ADP-heptose:LPS heptosyltransferase